MALANPKLNRQEITSVVYGGGLDLVTPSIQVDPGRVINVKNYECDLNNGYRTFGGYARTDGRTSPIDGDWVAMLLSDTTGFVIGETATGGTSSATGVIIQVSSQTLYMASVVGTFVDTEAITSPSASDTAASDPFLNVTLDDDFTFNSVRFLKEIHYRDLISAVPGVGKVLGIHRHLDKLYAFRNLDGSEAKMYEATTSGWAVKTLGHIVFFDTVTNQPSATEITVNDGVGNTATLAEIIFTTTGKTAGYMVLAGFTTGFAFGATIKEGATSLSTITVAAAAITLDIDGRYEMTSHNFSGGVTTYRVYGCDGVNSGFAFYPDNDRFIPIFTDQENQDIDNPTFVAVYKQQLFYGFARGIMRNSEPNDPLLWDAAAGTIEIGVGAELTGFDATPLSLTVMTRRITYALTGDIAENFQLDVSSSQTGAIAYTSQHIGTTYMLDDRGIIELSRVLAFGNFENATVSRLIKPLMDVLRPNVIASVVSRSKNIYRLITNTGRGISMTLQDGDVIGLTEFDLDNTVSVTANGEDETGAERIYFGDDDGFVYEMDVGRSFDGREKEAWLQPTPHFLASVTVLKRFYRMFIGTILEGTTTLSIYAELSLGTPDKLPVPTVAGQFSGLSSAWDIGLWDRAVFDARLSADTHIELTGSGDAISVIFYNTSATDDIITLKDVTYHYKFRRAVRGAR